MKNLEVIKNEVAVKNRYGKWDDIMFYHNGGGSSLSAEKLSNMVNEVAEEYAKQCCDEQISDWVELLSDGSNQPDKTGQYFVVIKGKATIATYAKQYKGWFASGQYYSDDFRNIGITHYSFIKMPNTPNIVTTK